MPGTDRTAPASHRRLRLPRPRAGLAATGLFLAALALSAATVPLIEPAEAGPSGTAQAALGTQAR